MLARRDAGTALLLAAIALASATVSQRGFAQQATANRASQFGTVDGLVADTSLRPLSGTTVSIIGTSIHVITGENGRFRLSDLPPGRYKLLAQRLGFEPMTVQLDVVKSDTLSVSLVLDKLGTPLDTVRVTTDKLALARHQDFEARRKGRGATASFTAEDIAKRNPTESWQMLTAVSAINVTDHADGSTLVVASSKRGMITSIYGSKKANEPCFLKVMVDGVAIAADDALGRTNLSNLPAPSAIYGIEVFAGPGTIPPQYSGAGDMKYCGLIAIWTK